jgi:hypothetical protein
LPDPDWDRRAGLRVYPTATGWTCWIHWGGKWGTTAVGTDEDPAAAIADAVKMALQNECPPEWIPTHMLPEVA